jgi:hypothetical protein
MKGIYRSVILFLNPRLTLRRAGWWNIFQHALKIVDSPSKIFMGPEN